VPHRRCILHGVIAQYETEFSPATALPSVVDRLSAGRERLNDFGADRF
jgi:hypothetical protein